VSVMVSSMASSWGGRAAVSESVFVSVQAIAQAEAGFQQIGTGGNRPPHIGQGNPIPPPNNNPAPKHKNLPPQNNFPPPPQDNFPLPPQNNFPSTQNNFPSSLSSSSIYAMHGGHDRNQHRPSPMNCSFPSHARCGSCCFSSPCPPQMGHGNCPPEAGRDCDDHRRSTRFHRVRCTRHVTCTKHPRQTRPTRMRSPCCRICCN
jgi:hypothetical protein